MFSEKSFKILYDLKYQLARLKANQAGIKNYLDSLKKKKNSGTPLTQQEMEQFKGYNAVLAMFNPDFYVQQRVNRVHTIVTVGQFLKFDIQDSLYKKLNIDPKKPEHEFDFSYQFMPDEVINFLKEEMSAQEKEIYERLQPKDSKSYFESINNYFQLQYDKMKWHYWYWPNLYYRENSWKVSLYILSKLLLGAWYTFLFITMMPQVMIVKWVTLTIFAIMGITASRVTQNRMEAFLLFCLIAAIGACLFFCPPISVVGLIFGVTLAYWPMLGANIAITMGLTGVDYGVRKLIDDDPKTSNPIDNLLKPQEPKQVSPSKNVAHSPTEKLESISTYFQLLQSLSDSHSNKETRGTGPSAEMNKKKSNPAASNTVADTVSSPSKPKKRAEVNTYHR